ncbi:MAG: hypothetical protein AABX50_00365 [Nanoarchaeota archaeon]
MPKHKNINKKKEKILEELATMLKSSASTAKHKSEEDSEINEKDSGLTNLDLKNLEFNPDLELEDTGAPVLEKIVGSQPRPIFVGGISGAGKVSGNGNGTDSKDEFKYVPGRENSDEPKYIPTSESQQTAIERIETESLGRRQDSFSNVNPERFTGIYEKNFQSSNIEGSPGRPERFDVEKAGRRDPFTPEDRRYKPKLPKI